MGKQMRGNSEVYVGIYAIIGIVIGGSSFMSAAFYWQMLRMRYMICPDLKAAFAKTHGDICMYLDYPIVPEGVRNMYYQLSDFLSGMGDNSEAASAPAEGGIMGSIKQTLSSCNIF
jgi:hypothetical protein